MKTGGWEHSIIIKKNKRRKGGSENQGAGLI
jgi:hypothetical protein